MNDRNPEIEERPYQKIRLMLVEANEMDRQKWGQLLSKEKVPVVAEVKSALEALDKLQKTNPNVFIINVLLPEVSGIELARKIGESLSDCFVIILSPLQQESILTECMGLMIWDFFCTPVGPEDLINSLRKINKTLMEGLRS